MKLIEKIANRLFHHQKKLEFIALLLLFISVSFSFDGLKSLWLWNKYSFVAIILVLMIVVLSLTWIQIEKIKTSATISKIKNTVHNTDLINELTTRQKEVFDLIIEGKTNKEIIEILFIEQSTLKTHINKIYKILGITSRKQLKNF